MLHPSRLFTFLLVASLILMAYLAVTEKNQFTALPSGEISKQRFLITAEPKIIGNRHILIVQPDDCPDCSKIQVTQNQFPSRKYGEILELSGKTKPIEPEDPYFNYYYQQGIAAKMSFPKVTNSQMSLDWKVNLRAKLILLRQSLSLKISRLFPEPEAGLLNGIIFGERADLTDKFSNELARTGTTHIIALSGFNITIIIYFLTKLIRVRNRKLYTLLALVGITIFVLATGLSASVIRAALMGAMMLFASLAGRKSDGLNAVLFAAAIMVALNPAILVYDIGFQLSFAAVLGIIFLAPLLEKPLAPLGKALAVAISGTVAAHLYTWPLIALYFKTFSVVAPLTNTLIVPLIPFVMAIGSMASIAGFISLYFAKFIAFFAWILLAYITKVITLFSELSFASKSFSLEYPELLMGYYSVLLISTIYLNKRRLDAQVH